MGVGDYVSDLCSLPKFHGKHKKKPKDLQTVEIKVRIDCEGCVHKVRKAVEGMEGVESIDVDPKQHKLTVIGYVDPQKVLKRVRRKTGKNAVMWPYVPYDTVSHPYVAGVYDKKAPPGYVRNAEDDPNAAPLARASSLEAKYTTAFSDDNPNNCVVMYAVDQKINSKSSCGENSPKLQVQSARVGSPVGSPSDRGSAEEITAKTKRFSGRPVEWSLDQSPSRRVLEYGV